MSTNPNTSDELDVPLSKDNTTIPLPEDRLRWWPALVVIVLMLVLRAIPMLMESPSLPVMMLGFMGPPAVGLLLLPWWLFASRAPLREKLIGLLGLLVVAAMAIAFVHPTMRGVPNIMYQLPVGLIAFAVPLVLLSRFSSIRLTAALVSAVIGFGAWDLLRFDGVTGVFGAQFSSRWSSTSEDEYLNQLASSSLPTRNTSLEIDPGAVVTADNAEWPAFRGRSGNNVIPGVVVDDDWSNQPPKLLWKSLIGPGWSSFSVAGNRMFTQEQRGESEAVVCLDTETGEVIWAYEYLGRFEESLGGVGPRATPTIGDGALFCTGADGTISCLDPTTGELIWKRHLREDAGREPPSWGWSSSPLVVESKAIVHAGGDGDKGVIAYDTSTGEIAWSVTSGNHSYSSPQLAEVNGIEGILMLTNDGLQFLSVTDGHTIWDHEWVTEHYRALQPLATENSILIADSMGEGTRRLSVNKSGDSWQVTEDWTSRSMKPQFNDFVLYDGYVYGFDMNIFACMDAETGEKKWKRGRYGNGQVLLLSPEGQLLVTSEEGEIVLLKATPDRLTELAKFPAIEGKTWNHPILVGDRLYVRNGQEVACYQLPLK